MYGGCCSSCLFSDNQSKNTLQICKTTSDDAGRMPFHVGVIRLPVSVSRKLQCQLILCNGVVERKRTGHRQRSQ